MDDFDKAASYLADPKTLGLILGAGGLSGLAGGYLSSKNREARRGETKSQRRRRILKNALLSALAGGGAMALSSEGVKRLGNVTPSQDQGLMSEAEQNLKLGLLGGGATGAALYKPWELLTPGGVGPQKEHSRRMLKRLALLGAPGSGLKMQDISKAMAQSSETGGRAKALKAVEAAIANMGSFGKPGAGTGTASEVLDKLLMEAGYAPRFKPGKLGDAPFFQNIRGQNLKDIPYIGSLMERVGAGDKKIPLPESILNEIETPNVMGKVKQFFAGDSDLEKLFEAASARGLTGKDVAAFKGLPQAQVQDILKSMDILDTPYVRNPSRLFGGKSPELLKALSPRLKGLAVGASALGLPLLYGSTVGKPVEL